MGQSWTSSSTQWWALTLELLGLALRRWKSTRQHSSHYGTLCSYTSGLWPRDSHGNSSGTLYPFPESFKNAHTMFSMLDKVSLQCVQPRVYFPFMEIVAFFDVASSSITNAHPIHKPSMLKQTCTLTAHSILLYNRPCHITKDTFIQTPECNKPRRKANVDSCSHLKWKSQQ